MPTGIEQLQQRLRAASEQVEKIDLMIELSSTLRRTDAAESLKLASKALRLASLRKDAARIARGSVAAGFSHYYLCDYGTAITHFQKAGALCDPDIDRRTHAESLHGLGITYTDMGEYVKAIEALGEALEFAGRSEEL